MSQQNPFPIILGGGLDLRSSAIQKPPGSLISCLNYESTLQPGYSRIKGYERFDGRPSPSAAKYYLIDFTSGGIEPIAGAQLLGGTSGATGTLLAVSVSSGDWATGDAVGYFVITKLTSNFLYGETIRDAGDTQTHAIADSAAEEYASDAYDEEYVSLAAENYRSDIQTVPGSGEIRGVWMYNNAVYAFRDNAGGTACNMWQSSSSGWQAVDLGVNLTFITGSTSQPSKGDVVTGGTSGATGLVTAVRIDSGSFAANDAAGKIYIHTVSGTFISETITYTSGSLVSNAVSVQTLPPGGRYEFINYNFYGQASDIKMYGCNGVGKAFQFDETGFCMIDSGMISDTPSHISAHKKHLFLSFNSSVQHSSLGDPLSWSALTGASEIALGDNITGYQVLPGETLAIFTRNERALLYGDNVSNWSLVSHTQKGGAIEWTIQPLNGVPTYLDDPGLTNLTATDATGDFMILMLSENIDSLIQNYKTQISHSVVLRSKSQYRLFFTDNTFLIMTQKGQSIEFTTCEYPVPVLTCTSGEDGGGTERVFFGSNDGYVYEMDVGKSFDGATIPAFIRLPFGNFGHSERIKRIFRAVIEIENMDTPDISILPDYDYASPEVPVATLDSIGDTYLRSSGAFFDGSDYWSRFFWDGVYMGRASAHLNGSGINVSLLLRSSSATKSEHTIQSIILYYAFRGVKY